MLQWVFIFLMIPQIVFAWGTIGHRAIGELTEKSLQPKVKAKVQKLLGRDNLAEASIWADIVKSNPAYKFQNKWHYTNIEDGKVYKKFKKKSKNPRDVIEAIDLMVRILKNQASHPKVSKSEALKYLIHFVEDLHQPLHAGRRIDRGGSIFYVTFFDELYQLHRLWDSGLIERLKLSYTELTSYLQRQYQGTPVEQLTPEDWANESAKLLPYVYFFDDVHFEKQPSLMAHQDILKKYPDILDRIESKTQRPRLHFIYLNRTLPILLKRMYEASVRLAYILNDIFS